MLETHKVKSNISNMLTINLTNGEQIHVTKDHYILTTNGWIPAKDLIRGDLLLDYKTVSNMWERIPHRVQNVFNSVWKNFELATSSTVSSSKDVYSKSFI